MIRRAVLAMAAGALAVTIVAPGALAAGSSSRTAAAARQAALGRVRDLGYVQTPGYLAAKARANARAARQHAAPAAAAQGPHDPVETGVGFPGPFDPSVAPSDSVGAVGPDRYVALVNEQYAIYARTPAGTTPTPLSSGPLSAFTPVSADAFGLFDPQIIWDAGTQRFYYVMDDIVCGSLLCSDHEDYKLAWGYSMTASPSSPADWCHYQTDFGVYGTSGEFPDYPKLGDTQDFLLVGINNYPHLQDFAGSDIGWIAKPPPGPTCPDQSSFQQGIVQDVRGPDGATAFTPVPANQIDDSHTGYVLASVDLGEPGSPEGDRTAKVDTGSTLTVFRVTKGRDGSARFGRKGRAIPVPDYQMPPSAPQAGSAATLDTLDARLTNAQQVLDPVSGRQTLYTQHAVAGGAGSEVRWYKIDAKRRTVSMTEVSDPSLYVFNAAISTDRANPGPDALTAPAFGDAVMLGVTTSSPDTTAADQMVSKIGDDPQSGLVLVHQSDAPDEDFTCFDGNGDPATCRWGDYSAATPDPVADPTGAHGQVFFINMWSSQGDPVFGTGYWRTWIWSATP